MELIKVDYLNVLDKTLYSFKKYLNDDNKIIAIKIISTSGDKSFSSFDGITEYFLTNDYKTVQKIVMVLETEKEYITVQANKEKERITVTQTSKEVELNSMFEDIDISMVQDDDCTYYQFEYGKVGKFDPKTLCYYIWTDKGWKVCGEMNTWMIDPGYDYVVIKKPNGENNKEV